MFKCKICGKEFEKQNSLGGHVVTAHKNLNKKKEFKCEICGEILYTNKGAFENHIKGHNIEWKMEKDKNISISKKEFYANEERSKFAREYMSQFMKENNPMFDEETVNKMIQSRKEYMDKLSDDEYNQLVTNFINAPKKGNAVNHSGKYTPTKIEQMIIDFNIPGLIYSGNKKESKTIRFKDKTHKSSVTPDFICEFDDSKFIEVFGVYWHPQEDEDKYVKAYSENGYNILIIWEDNLYKNPIFEKEKILEFLRGD